MAIHPACAAPPGSGRPESARVILRSGAGGATEHAPCDLAIALVDQILVQLVADDGADVSVEFLAQLAEEARRRDDAQLVEALLPPGIGEVLGDAAREVLRLEVLLFLARRRGDARRPAQPMLR